MNMQVTESADGDKVTITLGNRSLTATEEDDGGRVTIDLGDRIIEIVGDDDGGSIHFDSPEGTEGAEGAAEDPSSNEGASSE